MALWKIEYWKSSDTGNNPVKKWLTKLTVEQVDAVFLQLSRLENAGNELELPHSKALGKGLFELREMQYGYRIYYGFHGKLVIVVVAAGDKTSQDKDIKIARQRLSQIKKG